MATQKFINNFAADVAATFGIADTQLTLSNVVGLPALSGGDWFNLTVFRLSGVQESGHEVVKVTGVAGNIATVVRSVEGAAASQFNIGDKVEARISAAALTAKADLSRLITDEGYIAALISDMVTKAPSYAPTFTGTVTGITATMVGLGNVNNTADSAKPVSTAQQTALDLKANLANPTFTGTVNGISKSMVGLGSVDNTSDAGKPVSTAQQAALDLKLNLTSKDASGGYAGMTGYQYNFKNLLNTFTSFMQNSNTAARTYSFPNKDGTVAMLSDIPSGLTRYPLFSATTVGLDAASNFETIENSMVDTGLGSIGIYSIQFASSIFVASPGQGGSAASNVASSPDGLTWTLRAMPSSQIWYLGSEVGGAGTYFIAAGSGSAKVSYSANGTSWSALTDMSTTIKTGACTPAIIGTKVIIPSSTSTINLVSSNSGTSFSQETAPAANGGYGVMAINGLFWYYSSGTTAYTSSTGLTGSWTARTLPVSPTGMCGVDTDGALLIGLSSSPVMYRSTDGINWAATNAPPFTGNANSSQHWTINGVITQFSNTFGLCGTYHKNQWVMRKCTGLGTQNWNVRAGKNLAGTVYLFTHNGTDGKVIRVEPAAVGAPTGLFG